MKLCTFQAQTRLGAVKRLRVVTLPRRVLDANFAYALALAERDGHPAAYEAADALLPANMLAFLRNGPLPRCYHYARSASR